MNRSSSHALLGVLAANGVDRVFLVPGESYLGVLDALSDFDSIDVVTCRHEAGAGFMAVADGRLARRPGVLLVSRGPGAANASIAVHTAQQDAVPLILIVGQIPKRDLRREAFQEIDYQKMFGSIAKWVFEVTDPAQVAEAAFRAVRVATAGTPGPVVLVLPEDIQQQPVACPAWQAHPHAPVLPASDTMDALHARLRAAQRPLIVAGGMFDVPGGREVLQRLAEHWQCPVVVSFRRQDLFPNAHPLYAGDVRQWYGAAGAASAASTAPARGRAAVRQRHRQWRRRRRGQRHRRGHPRVLRRPRPAPRTRTHAVLTPRPGRRARPTR